uniref:Uncharacterized protein n=1 Tax=Arion vulgaris TaxID=1028688 RepID=A0A0B6ZGM4_9EUPU
MVWSPTPFIDKLFRNSLTNASFENMQDDMSECQKKKCFICYTCTFKKHRGKSWNCLLQCE